MCVCVCAQSYASLCSPMDCSLPGSLVHEIFQPRMEGICLFLLQGIFPTQELNPYILCLQYCMQILYHWDTIEAPYKAKYIRTNCILEENLDILDYTKFKEKLGNIKIRTGTTFISQKLLAFMRYVIHMGLTFDQS